MHIKRRCFSSRSNNVDNIIFESFISNDRVIVRNKLLPDISINLPINTPLNFTIDDIAQEIFRLESLNFLIQQKNNKRKQLVIFHNNALLVGAIELLIKKSNYKSYHIFCGGTEALNSSKYLEHYYKVRLNSIEQNFTSALRILVNEYEDSYESDDIDTLICFSKNNTLAEVIAAIQWKHRCYISIDCSNLLFVSILRFLFRDQRRIDIALYAQNYILLSVNDVRSNYLTTVQLVNRCKKYWQSFLRYFKRDIIN